MDKPTADCQECFSYNPHLPPLPLLLHVVVQREGVQLGPGEHRPGDESVVITKLSVIMRD